MALVRHLELLPMERNSLHDEVKATYTAFNHDGRILLQIDTYGRPDREIPGKKSQSIQLDEGGARELFEIMRQEFRF